MNEGTITKVALKTIEEALETSKGDKSGTFSHYVDGVVAVSNALVKELNGGKNKKRKGFRF